MPIDPSIVLNLKPYQQPDTLGMLAKVMAIKQAQDQGRLADLQYRAAQRGEEQNAALRQAAQSLPPGATLADLANKAFQAGDFKTGTALMKEHNAALGRESTINLNIARAKEIGTKSQASGALAQLLATGGYQGNAENPVVSPPTAVMMNDAAAREAALAADARGERVAINVPNQGTVQGLAALANPQSITEVLKQMNPASQRPAATSPIAKLMAERDALPQGHPARAVYDQAIEKASTHQAPVNIYSGSLTPAVDASGKPVFLQPSGREGVPPRAVSGYAPPPPAAESKATESAAERQNTVGRIRERITAMSKLIQSGGSMTGGVVGPQGYAARIAETARGVVEPGTPTPALDYQNEQRILVADVRKMIEKDPNLSNEERRNMMEMIGGGIWQTPGSAVRTLNNVLNFIEGKAARSSPVRTQSVVTTPRISSDADFQNLPSGTEFIAPDGSRRRKP